MITVQEKKSLKRYTLLMLSDLNSLTLERVFWLFKQIITDLSKKKKKERPIRGENK